MRYRFLPSLRVFAACVFAVVSAFCVRVQNLSYLATLSGAHIYYLDSASSQAVVKTRVLPWEIFRVKGESVTLYGGDAETIAKAFGGEQVCVERVGEVVSYYYRVEKWRGGIAVNGELVNLHIAVDGSRIVVGTPVIFGGF